MRFDGWDSLPPQSAPHQRAGKSLWGCWEAAGWLLWPTIAPLSACMHIRALPRVAALRSTAEVCTRTSLIAPMLEHQRPASQPLRTRTHFQSFCAPDRHLGPPSGSSGPLLLWAPTQAVASQLMTST